LKDSILKEKINSSTQSGYWDYISNDYQKITRIDCSDFHYGPQIPGEKVLQLLPEFKEGMSALEVGCGGAQNSVWLAKRGVQCTAFDVSPNQLRHARKIAKDFNVEIDLQEGGFADFRLKTAGREFDFVHSSHAIEFVQDPEAAVAEMAKSVKIGGRVMISTVHPLYNGDWLTVFDDVTGAERNGCFLENYFSPPDDVREEYGFRAISRAYSISAWFGWLKKAGLAIESFCEPAAVSEAPYTSDDWADHGGHLDMIPSTLIFVAVASERKLDIGF
jgi:2-polyprenyl-3-methyl-5-hydroxy-6-metoxy-1,4-benzoquinol methylase